MKAERLLKNRYELRELIGEGGMAAVYRGVDTALGREVAIKIFAASDDEIEGVRQEAEVNLLAGLTHHNLVTLLDAGVDRSDRAQPQVFIVMELVRGADLQRTLLGGPLSARQAGQIGFDLAEALSYMHQRGVTHRDIKPSNVLVVDYEDQSSRARAKLTDFGIAYRDGQPHEVGSSTTGTAAYLSPEQVKHEPVGPATDIYSLGLVLLECFTAELAYPGGPVDSAMTRLMYDPDIPRSLPSGWRGLLSAMTSLAPADRPSAAEVVLALRDLVLAEMGRHRTGETMPPTADGEARIDALREYDLLDTPPDKAFDRITAIAARSLSAPIAIVSLVGSDRVWFSSRDGLESRLDPRSLLNPVVAGEFGLQFYAEVALTTDDGIELGGLRVLDFEPRTASDDEMATLNDLAALVVGELEVRSASRDQVADESVVT